jgi:hypothetical protein
MRWGKCDRNATHKKEVGSVVYCGILPGLKLTTRLFSGEWRGETRGRCNGVLGDGPPKTNAEKKKHRMCRCVCHQLPNVSKLSGDGGAAAGVGCSAVFGRGMLSEDPHG